MSAKECPAITRHRHDRLGTGEEGHAVGEIAIEGIASNDGAGRRIDVRHHVQMFALAWGTQDPLVVRNDAQTPALFARVHQCEQ